MKYDEMFPSRFLKASDFSEDEIKVVTIKNVELVEIGKKGEETQRKPVVFFRENGVKPLVCNKTNATIIVKLYGDDTDEWIGKRISLFVTQVESFGEQVDAIRVRAKVPTKTMATQPQAVQEEAQEEELPFDSAARKTLPPLQLGERDLPRGAGVDVPSKHIK